ncbi:choice-of-anchor Q domain-containing protein [Aquisphaera insulae]|uniref:choice-of-anchor Q domain-containing protein n=1 Tax=Aquisphaera insulae TaxID=2712864 RepID=UPI0013EAD50B|nr:choice-of-anchor Q domain-containing protein [Aquisphaera insulae]
MATSTKLAGFWRTRRTVRHRRPVRPVLEALEPKLVLSSGSSFQAVPGAVPVMVMGPAGKPIPLFSTSPTGYTPQQIRAAYGMDTVSFAGIKGDGAGQTIAIIDAYDNPSFVSSTDPGYANSALAVFNRTFGLPDPPSFTKVDQYGGTDRLPIASVGAGWGVEIALDVEWAHVMAPAANIVLIECDYSEEGFFTAQATASKLADVVSMSYSQSEYPGESGDQDGFFNVPGVTFLASTGDYGAPAGYPAYSPYVVAVGGTTLQNLDAAGTYPGIGKDGEIGWSGSGGGVSQYEPLPPYQSWLRDSDGNPYPRRAAPDISAVADPNTGVPIYDPFDFGVDEPWLQIGGTSLSAPLMAGLVAVVDQGRELRGGSPFSSTETLTALYDLASDPVTYQDDFHDILYGSNGYDAGVGYDLVTGLGSPNGSKLIPDLAAYGLGAQATLVSLAVTPADPSLGLGLTEQFRAIGTFDSGLTMDLTGSVTWDSSDPSVATIDGFGIAAAVSPGTTVITASLLGITSPDDTLTVLSLVSIALKPSNPLVPVYLSQQFTATATYADGSTGDVTSVVDWESSDTTVATIDASGLATALDYGTTVITASLGGVTSPDDILTGVDPSFVVDTTVDLVDYSDGLTSLREAILAANVYADETVTFDPGVFASHLVITLMLGQLKLSNTTGVESIVAPDAGVTIDARNLTRVLDIDSGVTASITGLTITGGDAYYGGGIRDEGAATLIDCIISGNSAALGGGVAAVYGSSSLELIGSTVSGNLAWTTGGGLLSILSKTSLSGSDFESNVSYGTGGAITALTAGDPMTIDECVISGNVSIYGGGGVYAIGFGSFSSSLSISNSSIEGNTAYYSSGGGIFAYGLDLSLTNCSVSGNQAGYYGGGLYLFYGTAEISDTSISGNTAGSTGGGIDAFLEDLTMEDCDLSGNTAFYNGGGLEVAYGSASLTGCTISENATYYGWGGGIREAGSSLELTDCTVSGNVSYFGTGGGIEADNGSITLKGTDLTDNRAPAGGGLYAYYSSVELDDCTVSGNVAHRGAGIYSYVSGMTLTDCTVSGNIATFFGGGVLSFASSLEISGSAITGNYAGYYGGGVIGLYSTLDLVNCTVAENSSGAAGGGLWIDGGDATLTNVTVAANSSGDAAGLYVAGGTPTLINTIVAGNTGSGGASDISGSVVGNNNLIGTGGSGGLVDGTDGNIVGVADALLAPLGDYGGPTETMPLLPGSLAIDAGTDGAGIPDTDQRGEGRVGGVDIGAFESQGFTITIVSGSPQSAVVGTQFTDGLTVTVTAKNSVEPVDGGVVSFAANPSGGASATLSASSSVISGGEAVVTATANGVAGSYTVSASASGASGVLFSLQNAKASIVATSVAWGTGGTAELVTAADGLRLLPTGRKTDIPWYGLKVFTLTLDGVTSLSASNISLVGVKGGAYGFTFSLSGSTLTITLNSAITQADRITLTISSHDVATFTRRLDVLPGDANDDGIVNSLDAVAVRNGMLGSVVIPLIFLDINGDGVVDINDYNLSRQKIGTKLP